MSALLRQWESIAEIVEERELDKGERDYSEYKDDPVGFVRDVLGENPTPDQEDVLRAIITPPYKVIVRSAHNVGKCRGADTLVTLADGSRVIARDLVGKAFEMLSIRDGKIVKCQAFADWNCLEPTYTLTTDTGHELTVNKHHPLWVADCYKGAGKHPRLESKGWTHLEHIKVGDVVAIASELPACGEKEMLEHEVKILAYMIGDGGYTTNTISFTQQDNKQLEEFSRCVEMMGDTIKPLKYGEYGYAISGSVARTGVKTKRGIQRKRMPNNTAKLLKRHGLKHTHSRDKKVPDAIFRLPMHQQALFLNRLFSTDGWACQRWKSNCGEIGFCSISERLVRDVKHLCQRFGIHGSIYRKALVNAWVFSIYNARDVARFAELIGIYGKEDGIARATEKLHLQSRDKGKWRLKNAHPCTRWEQVREIRENPPEMTVAISVPDGHTYLDEFYEHNSWLCACIILWFSKTQGDNFRLNSTASTYDQINEAVWGEVRAMDAKSGLNLMSGVRPVINLGPKAVAKGFTAKTPTAFQGRRGLRNGLIADEAMGIDPGMFPAMESIYGGERYFGLYTFNPTDPSSHLRLKEETGEYRVIVLSQENHPNIIAARKGEPLPYPSAITLEVYEKQLRERSDPVIGEPMPQDVLIGWKYGPNGEKVGGEWRRPNYEACCRNLGRWPDQSAVSIWTPALWDYCCKLDLGNKPTDVLQIGLDVARYGSCNTAFAVRYGGNLLHLESYNGWNTSQIAERARELCFQFGRQFGKNPKEIPVAIDGTGGWGAGVEDQAEQFNFIPVIAGEKAIEDQRYYLVRDELWCGLREHAEAGGVSFKLLPENQRALIRQQALAAKYEYRGTKKKVLPKEEMADSLNGRSPDEFESVLLAFANVTGIRHRERVAGRVV